MGARYVVVTSSIDGDDLWYNTYTDYDDARAYVDQTDEKAIIIRVEKMAGDTTLEIEDYM